MTDAVADLVATLVTAFVIVSVIAMVRDFMVNDRKRR